MTQTTPDYHLFDCSGSFSDVFLSVHQNIPVVLYCLFQRQHIHGFQNQYPLDSIEPIHRHAYPLMQASQSLPNRAHIRTDRAWFPALHPYMFPLRSYWNEFYGFCVQDFLICNSHLPTMRKNWKEYGECCLYLPYCTVFSADMSPNNYATRQLSHG